MRQKISIILSSTVFTNPLLLARDFSHHVFEIAPLEPVAGRAPLTIYRAPLISRKRLVFPSLESLMILR